MGFLSTYLKKNESSLSLERDSFNKKNNFLNELHVNGVDVSDDDDFSIDDEEETNDTNPSDQAQDAADNPDSTEQDAAPMTDPDNSVEDEDDFTLQDDDGEEPQSEESEPVENTEEAPAEENTQSDDTPVTDEANVDAGGEDDDFTLQDDDEEQPEESESASEDNGEVPAEEADGEDDDFTMDDGGNEGGDTAPAESDGGDQNNSQQQSSGGNDNAPADPSDNIPDEDIKSSEEQMYDTLTDDQKRIRTLSLKMEFKDLYESILTVIEGINGIPKSLDNIDSIKRVTNYVTKAKNILIDYIQNNFDQNPYLENYAIYVKFMAIFRTVANVINDLNAAAGKPTNIDIKNQ